MPDTYHYDYEVASQGDPPHLTIPIDRLENSTSVIPTNAAKVKDDILEGGELTGTILALETFSGIDCIILDADSGQTYRHNVRNVLTYAQSAEATWNAINVGDTVYYDDSATMPADCHLSLSADNSAGDPNPVFGHVGMSNDTVNDTFPKGSAQEGVTVRCVIIQRGAGT